MAITTSNSTSVNALQEKVGLLITHPPRQKNKTTNRKLYAKYNFNVMARAATCDEMGRTRILLIRRRPDKHFEQTILSGAVDAQNAAHNADLAD